MKTKVAQDTWITRDEALELLQCSVRGLRRLVADGQVHMRTFGHRRYWREDVERAASPPDRAA